MREPWIQRRDGENCSETTLLFSIYGNSYTFRAKLGRQKNMICMETRFILLTKACDMIVCCSFVVNDNVP